jgi:hypothetical protein
MLPAKSFKPGFKPKLGEIRNTGNMEFLSALKVKLGRHHIKRDKCLSKMR